MKVKIAVQKISTYPLYSEEHPRSTTFPASRMPLWPSSSNTMQFQRIVPQPCMQKIDRQLLWWWWHHRRWYSFPLQCTTSTVPCTWSMVTIFQVHPLCFYSPGRRRRIRRGGGGGPPNHFVGWWTLDNWRNSRQTIMYTWTFFYHTDYAHIYVPFWLPNLLLFQNHGLSDISKFKELMTTSSDEDIPALNDIGNQKDSG